MRSKSVFVVGFQLLSIVVFALGVNLSHCPGSFRCDKDIKVSYTVYNRLSLLLKSLLAITRVTPAYKLSRKQGHDYVILYRSATKHNHHMHPLLHDLMYR